MALKQLDTAHKVRRARFHHQAYLKISQIVSGRKTNTTEYEVPRIVTLGGDHTTTLSALRSTYQHWGQVSVIHFDSHLGNRTSQSPTVGLG